MSSKTIVIILVVVLAAIGLYLTEQYWLKPATQQAQAAGLELMQPMPETTLYTRDDTPVSLSDYKGKALVINFWATWCLPCRVEMPFFNKVYNEYRDQDVVFIGVSEDELGWPAIDQFIEELAEEKDVHIDYPILLDPDGSVGEAFGGLIGLPTTIFVDRAGRITRKHSSIMDIDDLRTSIDRLLGTTEAEPAAAGEANGEK